MSLLFKRDFGLGDPGHRLSKKDKPLRVRFDFALKSAPLEPKVHMATYCPAQSRHHAAQETWSRDVLIPLC
jgi:hypothetical protein